MQIYWNKRNFLRNLLSSNKLCIAAGRVENALSVFIHVTSSYANLLEQENFFK